jgi:hypothetical protein
LIGQGADGYEGGENRMMRSGIRPRAIAPRLAIALLVAVCSVIRASDATASTAQYVGHALESPMSVIDLKVRTRAGAPDVAIFRAREVRITCEDGTTRDWTPPFDPIELDLRGSKHTFDGHRYEYGQPTSYEYVLRIHGRLMPGGRAEGYFLAYLNPYDPPGLTNDPECTTAGGRQAWSARRDPTAGKRIGPREHEGPRLGAVVAADARTETYVGSIGLARSVMRLAVTAPDRGRPQGTFTVDDLRLYCEDGSRRFVTPPPIELRFTNRRAFVGDLYVPSVAGASESSISVHGRIGPQRNRALGAIYAFDNPADAEETDAIPECSTRIDFRWIAERDR